MWRDPSEFLLIKVSKANSLSQSLWPIFPLFFLTHHFIQYISTSLTPYKLCWEEEVPFDDARNDACSRCWQRLAGEVMFVMRLIRGCHFWQSACKWSIEIYIQMSLAAGLPASPSVLDGNAFPFWSMSSCRLCWWQNITACVCVCVCEFLAAMIYKWLRRACT